MDESYGMIMTADLEGRIQTMRNLSENIEAKGIEKGIEEERANAIKRMLKAGATKEQILSYGYTEKELTEISQNFNVSVDFSTPSIV
jgi:hypothetical protein